MDIEIASGEIDAYIDYFQVDGVFVELGYDGPKINKYDGKQCKLILRVEE